MYNHKFRFLGVLGLIIFVHDLSKQLVGSIELLFFVMNGIIDGEVGGCRTFAGPKGQYSGFWLFLMKQKAYPTKKHGD